MASMASDQQSGQLVLFGGTPSSGVRLADTWIWNSTTNKWAQQTPATSPPGRANAAMAYDPSMGSGELVLFGGLNINTIPMNDTWAWNGSTWAEQSPALSPSPRQDTSLAYDSGTGQMLLYGGFYNGLTCPGSSSDWCNDTWSWTGSTWGLLAPTVNPGARTLAGLAYDAAANQMVMYGGNYNATDQTDTWLIGPPSVSSISPAYGPAAGGTSVSITGTGFTGVTGVSFGSVRSRRPTTPSTRPLRSRQRTPSRPAPVDVTVTGTATGTAVASPATSADQYTYVQNVSWYQVSPAGPPSARQNSVEAYDPATNQTVLYSGSAYGDGHVGLERLGLDRGGHRRPAGPDRLVHGLRRGHQPAHPFRRFQRERRPPRHVGLDRLRLDRARHRRTGARSAPLGDGDGSATATSQLVLFGGLGGGGALSDTWAWNSSTSTWAQLSPATSPLARSAAVMAYDPATSQLVLFGGGNTTSPYSDTWTWNGTTWDQLYPSVSPPGRNFATLAYDPTSSQLLLSGGCSTLTLTTACVMSDTWAWDGSWSQLSPATAPSPRWASTMAFDANDNEMVLFRRSRRPAMWRTPGRGSAHRRSPRSAPSPVRRPGPRRYRCRRRSRLHRRHRGQLRLPSRSRWPTTPSTRPPRSPPRRRPKARGRST